MLLRRRTALFGSLLLVLSLCAVSSAGAQDRLLSPAEFLGYELGSRFTPHHRVVDYVEHVAAHASTVRLQRYGETNEGRPLLVALVSSEENMARLEDIRTNNLKMTGLLDGEPNGTTPALVWLSYNVHGNESVSTEAAMATLYDLADPTHTRTQTWLANTVVILDPCINPDGRDRYVTWHNRMVGRFPNPNPDAREHREPWPGGRTNHYYFDLNRDWAWATQVETQQRLVLYNQWLPHIHVDFHEQGVDAPYYFAPAAEPYHEAITGWQRELQTIIGQNHARYFDQHAWLYFTRQIFDLFYPGYGDTWPIFNGAVGMTYEQGGGGRAGLGIVTAEGDTLTLHDRIAHHHTTSLSTVETAANNHERIVQEFARYFEQARTAPSGNYKTFIVKSSDNLDKLNTLAAHLDHQGIRYGFATRARQTRGFSYLDGSTGAVSVEPGDLIVNTYQPKGVLARVLFEPEAALSDSLSYDVTAWALPYVYGLHAYALPDRLDPDASTHRHEASPGADLDRPFAYLAEWKSFEDVQFLAAVLNAGVKLRFSEAPFEIDGHRYDAGTLILTRTGNEALGDRFDQIVRDAAATLNQPLYPVATAFVTDGPDFGSSDVPFLRKPRVAVLAGDGVSSSGVGEVWHFFDQQLGYPVTLINTGNFGSTHLYDYDVLILPNGSYGRTLTENRLNDVKAWTRAGGKLIAMERAAGFLAGKDGFSLKSKKDEEEKKDEDKDPDRALRTYAERNREAISEDVTGAVFRAHLDPTHPLAFGYEDTYYTLRRGDAAYAFLEEDWNVGVLREDVRVSGFAGAKAQKKVENTLVFGVQNMGRGEVVYLLDDLLFRSFWYNGRLLFGNAVFLVGQRSPASF
ncbi:MAG: M14 family metallopeptidase [Rhodothermales bacterium]